jgi:hypothetical protein
MSPKRSFDVVTGLRALQPGVRASISGPLQWLEPYTKLQSHCPRFETREYWRRLNNVSVFVTTVLTQLL